MEFEYAAKRLERDQAKYRGRSRGGPVLSVKAKRQAEYRKKQQEKTRLEKEKKRKQYHYIQSYFNSCERRLGVKTLHLQQGEYDNSASSLQLQPTSIYGDGDKISLPPSVLQFLSTNTTMGAANGSSSPWIFRIGILNPNYNFPSSKHIQSMTAPKEDDDDDDDEDRDVYMGDNNNDSDDDDHDENNALTPYLKELGEKYVSYTHGTVVEFTQEDGYIGLPKLISSALLAGNKQADGEVLEKDDNNNESLFQIPVTRTVDPSTITTPITEINDGDDEEEMEKEETVDVDDDETTKTPGHIAYGKFDIPDMKIEINLIKLPKGSGCTLVPTINAIKNGFYNLKDVKLVLEQSLIRTRATLSIGDTVYTWHRGIQYDLTVSDVSPSIFHAISCINTDIEVIIGENEAATESITKQQQQIDDEKMQQQQQQNNDENDTNMPSSGGYTLAGGYVNKSSGISSINDGATVATTQILSSAAKNLMQEPPIDKKEGICTVQIRTPNGKSIGRRRFDIHRATIHDLFTFVVSLLINDNKNKTNDDENSDDNMHNSFRLVTRYPRRIFSYENESTPNDSSTLANAGIISVQELFMVEEVV